MINKTMFAHLLKHAQYHKEWLKIIISPDPESRELLKTEIAACVGALDCMYWQALGIGEILLAKHIRRYLGNRYLQHQVGVSCLHGLKNISQAA